MFPPSVKEVFQVIYNHDKPLTAQEISKNVQCSPRTVRYALHVLKKNEIVKEIPNLRDMRKVRYGLIQSQEQVRAYLLNKILSHFLETGEYCLFICAIV